MPNDKWQMTKRQVSACFLWAILVFVILLLPHAASMPPWQIYTFAGGSFVLYPASLPPAFFCPPPLAPSSPSLHSIPPDWHVTATTLADVTGDQRSEWLLLVWRPWRDWPIQRWSAVPSPIAGFHDAMGDSCHVILLDPRGGREIWAGSALPAPLLALAAGDVDGDGRGELVTLEGEYATGRAGPATHVDVWRWNGFGFTLAYRSPSGTFHQLCLTDANDDGTLDILIR